MTMKLDIITLFPGMFAGPLSESLLKRAQARGLVQICFTNPRDFARDAHKTVDDRPYGGGPGMVLKPEPLFKALRSVGVKKKTKVSRSPHVVFLSPQGKPFSQAVAQKLSHFKHLVLLCGHYEGIDERIMDWVHEEISIGDYVLTGGEIPAMVVTDAVVRLLPGVVKEKGSLLADSFSEGILDYPHYTRPVRWQRKAVPEVLLSGDHKAIAHWRQETALKNTELKRPDLLKTA